MNKNNFLLVDLSESKTKKLAETITSDTSRKILNHLAEKEDSEASIAKSLDIPISTVHYHLQKLVEANLVITDEFHYSEKGREINHYKLANKYIIIAPGKSSGMKEALAKKLKDILPVAGIVLGISAVIQFAQKYFSAGLAKSEALMDSSFESALESAPMIAKEAADESFSQALRQGPIISNEPNLAVWFLIGSLSSIVIYLIYGIIKEYVKEIREKTIR